MGINEFILFGTAIVSIVLVHTAWKYDRNRLFGVILIFLILISVAGGKIVEFFGYVTNTGNIFYASIFLATYFLIERYGSREGIRAIWIGVTGTLFFSVLLQFVILLHGSPLTGDLNAALSVAFAPLSRLSLASLMGFIFAQSFNVFLYTYLKDRHPQQHVWLRANVSNICSQIIDSLVFFSIAFIGVVQPGQVWEVLVTGFVIKVAFMVLAAPLLSLNRIEEKDDGNGEATVTLF